MATGGGSTKLAEDSDETTTFPESSPENGVRGGEEVLEVDDPIEFIDPLPKDFECSLCLQYLKQPALTSCGHHFCKQCIDRAVERSRKLKQDPVCPLCKEKDFQMFIDRSTERKISSLRVYCLKKSQGCRWEGELGSLDHHMDLKEGDCAFVEVECEFREMGCTTRVLRKDILKHMEENTHKHIILMSVLGSKMGGGSLESSRKLQEQRAEMLQIQLCRRDEEFQRRLEGLEKKLEKKSEELADMEQKLKVKDQELTGIDRRLQVKDDQLAEVKVQLQDKDKQLSKVEEQFKEKEGRLSVVEKKLGEREKQLISVEQRLKEKDKEQAEVKRGFQEKERHIQELQNSLQRKEEKADIRRMLQEQQDEMQEEISKQVKEKEGRLSVMEKKFGEREKQLISVEQRLKEKDKEQAEIKRSLQEKEQHIQELQNSLQRKEEQADIKRKLQEQKDEMQRQLQTCEKDMKQRIAELENDLQGRCPFYFVMLNFAKLKASSTEWFSPPFCSHPGGYKLSLRVDANGHGNCKGTHISWCLYTEPGEYDEILKWPRRRPKCYIHFLNHCTGKWEGDRANRDCCSAGTFKRPAPARQSIDCWHSTPHSDLQYNAKERTQYLKDDCLHFRVAKIEFID